jgi:hypothetical protein
MDKQEFIKLLQDNTFIEIYEKYNKNDFFNGDIVVDDGEGKCAMQINMRRYVKQKPFKIDLSPIEIEDKINTFFKLHKNDL